ncbi:hypothetical protein EHS13_01890 [Paenibacillus psychroresistens]|uniref:Uncharacterized protein n=1 Tax=Paenibacillus psychroresistens TaxID=1778678 RepID=A0A6B8RDC4_9BACL|nr:hypothetical protein [Paenibacillus psychroresistens]QGQ93744.1 hypothetical protein EHS13_01890 [Paenibacillus psychroresistens]
MYTYVNNNPLMYTDPSGNKPYAHKIGDNYFLSFSSKSTEYLSNALGATPFVGSWFVSFSNKASSLKDFSYKDIKAAKEYLSFSETESTLLDTYSSLSEKVASKGGKFSKLVGASGKILSFISTVSTAESFWNTFNYDSRIDHLIDEHLNISGYNGYFITGATKAELLAKYLYAYTRIAGLLTEGRIVYEGDSIDDDDYKRAYYQEDFDKIMEELDAIKKD